MRLSNVAFSALHFFVIACVFALGTLLVALSFSDPLRFQIAHLIQGEGERLRWIGGTIVGCGALLFFALFAVNRKSYLSLVVKGAPIQVSREVLQGAIESFFQERFPHEEVKVEVVIHRRVSLEILTNLPLREDVFEKIERELGTLLAERFDYQSPLILTIQLQSGQEASPHDEGAPSQGVDHDEGVSKKQPAL